MPCKIEGIKRSQVTGSGKVKLKWAELIKLYNGKVDDVMAFSSMLQHVSVQERLDPLTTSAVAIVYFWYEFQSDLRLLGQNAVDSILSALHAAHADVYLVSYEDEYVCSTFEKHQPRSYFELSSYTGLAAVLSFQLYWACSRLELSAVLSFELSR